MLLILLLLPSGRVVVGERDLLTLCVLFGHDLHLVGTPVCRVDTVLMMDSYHLSERGGVDLDRDLSSVHVRPNVFKRGVDAAV